MNIEAKGRMGSSFDDFLDEEGIRGEVEDLALKEIIAERVLGLPGDVRVDKDVAFKDMPTGR